MDSLPVWLSHPQFNGVLNMGCSGGCLGTSTVHVAGARTASTQVPRTSDKTVKVRVRGDRGQRLIHEGVEYGPGAELNLQESLALALIGTLEIIS
jgi:hypothetical protein